MSLHVALSDQIIQTFFRTLGIFIHLTWQWQPTIIKIVRKIWKITKNTSAFWLSTKPWFIPITQAFLWIMDFQKKSMSFTSSFLVQLAHTVEKIKYILLTLDCSGFHCGTFLAIASIACEAATLVSQVLLFSKLWTWNRIFSMIEWTYIGREKVWIFSAHRRALCRETMGLYCCHNK